MDKLTPERRSENMRRIRSTGTEPELTVRRLVHGLGYRYRIHSKNLPGKPDLVFSSRGKIILVHGCFWHQHSDPCCKIVRKPKSNSCYWYQKLDANIARDVRQLEFLVAEGWSVLIIWECQTRNKQQLTYLVKRFLG